MKDYLGSKNRQTILSNISNSLFKPHIYSFRECIESIAAHDMVFSFIYRGRAYSPNYFPNDPPNKSELKLLEKKYHPTFEKQLNIYTNKEASFNKIRWALAEILSLCKTVNMALRLIPTDYLEASGLLAVEKTELTNEEFALITTLKPSYCK